MTAIARPLVHRRVDGWMLGGAGLLAWLVVTPVFGRSVAPVGGVVTVMFAVITAMHFGASYHLAYGGGRAALREHPVALLVVPALLLTAGALVAFLASGWSADTARPVLRGLLVGVFTLTGWHYIKQSFGVAMLTVRGRGIRVGRKGVLALRYTLYPVWAFQVMTIYGHGSVASYNNVDIAIGVVPVGVVDGLRILAVSGGVVGAAVILGLALRMRGFPPAGLWATYLAASLWFLLPPGYISAGIVISGVHALQYMACAHRAEVDRAVETGEERLATWWLCVFGGAAAGGLLLATFLPALLDGSRFDATMPGMLGALVFVFMNLHHYAIDATIWRSGGEHVRRISHGPAVANMDLEPAVAPVPLRAYA